MQSSKPDNVVVLSNREPVATGTRQLVFEHPGDPKLLVKLLKPDTYDANGDLVDGKWIDHFRRATSLNAFRREFTEYLKLKVRFLDAELPICQISGIVQTDIGIGFVYEKISDPDGALSLTLRQLTKSKSIFSQHIDDLEKFILQLIDMHVVVSDLNLDNVVYQKREEDGGRFVCVDGIGSKQLVPLREWFPSQNKRKILQRREFFLTRMNRAIVKRQKLTSSKLARQPDTA